MARHEAIVLSVYPVNEPGTVSIVTAATELRILNATVIVAGCCLAVGREVTLVLAAGGSARTLSWPSWIAVGAALPTSLASGKRMVVSLTSTSTTDGAVIAAAAVQP